MQILDGEKLKKEILEKIKTEVASLSFVPVFCDVLVGDDLASHQYVKIKAKNAESVGVKFHNANFPVSITTEELIKEIQVLNKIENILKEDQQRPDRIKRNIQAYFTNINQESHW